MVQEQEALQAIATSLRCLSVDMIEQANSGHPGLPLGMADVAAVLYGKYLKHDPKDPAWQDRDRFVLSAGHGSALLYALLHVSGYAVGLEDLCHFRQLGARSAGHPEYGHMVGVETTTGPLAAGFATAVGMAIAQANLAKRFNTSDYKVCDHKTYVMMGDGCMMEGLSSEAASLAGHLRLGKLIAIYDDNSITIEGKTELAFSENVAMRFESYGWHVMSIDGHDFEQIDRALAVAANQQDEDKPLLIIAKTSIGKGAPNKAGTHKVHGAPLGRQEIVAMREGLGVPVDSDFHVMPQASLWMKERLDALALIRREYQSQLLHWQRDYSELDLLWREAHNTQEITWSNFQWSSLFEEGQRIATRVASGRVLQEVAAHNVALIGGSADLAPSNNTAIAAWGEGFSAHNRESRMLHFGVREHAMASIANGLQLHGGFRAFCSTFLVFSDYMRPAMRLAALMKLPIIYILTHDSIYVGEDGPTHQPIEHVESLRLIPNLLVLRPADAQECAWAWQFALEQSQRPVVLALSRQDLEVMAKPKGWQADAAKGGYIVFEPEQEMQMVILASGSEVNLAVNVAKKAGVGLRVVSVTERGLLEAHPMHRLHLIPKGLPVISVEAGVRGGWSLLAKDGALSLESFGASGKAHDVAHSLGLSEENLLSVVQSLLN